jgi:quercetin dioxygenase-like cupin family protein
MQRMARQLEHQAMAIHHALSGELIDIRPLGTSLKVTPSATLYKTHHLEVFRMVLLAGKEFPEHKMGGELTVQCLEGIVEFSIGTTRDIMRAGDLKCLAGGVSHSLVAVEDSSVLVTLLIHGA